jgi:hypothetical protein
LIVSGENGRKEFASPLNSVFHIENLLRTYCFCLIRRFLWIPEMRGEDLWKLSSECGLNVKEKLLQTKMYGKLCSELQCWRKYAGHSSKSLFINNLVSLLFCLKNKQV